MRRCLGVTRNRFQQLQGCKGQLSRRKNIFKLVGKEEDLSEDSHNSNHLLSTTTKHSSSSSEAPDTAPALEAYEEAKNHLLQVAEYKRKMAGEIRLRMASFKESETRVYDQNISKYSQKAVEHLLNSEKILASVRQLKGRHALEHKLLRNMEKSLALQIREASKSLRTQEKDYYDRLKAYETGTVNPAIQLRREDHQKMRDQFQDVVCEAQMGQDLQRSNQIAGLVRSINQLSAVYRQLNELVIEQGSLIDRIDFNIEQTYQHVERGVVHLKGADEKAESPCARKCMCFLIIAILAMSIVVGFKLSSHR